MKKIIIFLIMIGLTSTTQALTLEKYGEFKFEKVHQNLYIMHGPVVEPNEKNEGFMNNPTIVEGKTGLIIVDPGGNYNVGKKILAEIEKVSKKPILATINTHKHGDHWFANKALLEKYPNLKIYAHPQMIKEVKAGEADKWYDILERLTKNLKGTNDEFAYPNHAVKDGEVILIDDEKFIVRHPDKTHTNTDILIHHVNSNTLFLGDNVMKGRLGAFDSSSSIFGNIALLSAIMKEKECDFYIPGHGISGKRDATISPYLTYLTGVAKWAQKAYDDDLEAYEIKADAIKELKIFESWDGFEYAFGRHMTKAYDEISLSDEE
ncbi:MAG TPA: MBL fold metallo-hydrolase [Campylobacterales bacterium]|nr:MBL fold metallo-hydrolase [Campylobacterales bacterium]